MTFKTLHEVVTVVIKTIENSAVSSVRSLRNNIFSTKIVNWPETQKISGRVEVVNQTRVEGQLSKIDKSIALVSDIISKIKFPRSIIVENFPKPQVFPEFPKEIKVSNFSLPVIPNSVSIKGKPTVVVEGLEFENEKVVKAIRALKLNPNITVQAPKPERVIVPPANVTVKQQKEIDYDKLASILAKQIPGFDYKKFGEIISEKASFTVSGGSGKYAYKHADGSGATGLVDDDRHVQVDVLSSTPIPLPSEQIDSLVNASSQKNYTQIIDEASATVTYVGKAKIGSATSQAVWQIKKLDSTSGLVITWAGGTDAFTNKWDERTDYTYA